ncbi:MAG: hypothetical protein R2696_10625 [Microthrixaceae bacterium]
MYVDTDTLRTGCATVSTVADRRVRRLLRASSAERHDGAGGRLTGPR